MTIRIVTTDGKDGIVVDVGVDFDKVLLSYKRLQLHSSLTHLSTSALFYKQTYHGYARTSSTVVSIRHV